MEKNFTYRNNTKNPQAIANIGMVEPGKTITVPFELHNANFTLVEDTADKKAKDSKKEKDTVNSD